MPRPAEREAPILAPVDIAADGDAVSHSLAVLSEVYHYNHWVFDSIRDYLRGSVVEVGAGIGNITQFLLNLERVVCLEPFEPYRRYLSQRLEPHRNVAVLGSAIQDCPGPEVPAAAFDSVICLNVLEHIADDLDALRRMAGLARPGGRVVVFVPALPVLYGEMDRAMGHVRRYTLRGLRRLFRDAGLRPIRGRYMNLIGAAAWFWRGRVRRKSTVPESATKLFDRMVPFISAAERLLPILFGQSVLVVGEKPA